MSEPQLEAYVPSYSRTDNTPNANRASQALAAELDAVAQISDRKVRQRSATPAKPGTLGITKPQPRMSWLQALREALSRE